MTARDRARREVSQSLEEWYGKEGGKIKHVEAFEIANTAGAPTGRDQKVSRFSIAPRY